MSSAWGAPKANWLTESMTAFTMASAGSLRYAAEMDVAKIITELREEREQIDLAIMSLERLALGSGKRRGRPPAWMTALQAGAPRRRGRPPGSRNKPKTEEPEA